MIPLARFSLIRHRASDGLAKALWRGLIRLWRTREREGEGVNSGLRVGLPAMGRQVQKRLLSYREFRVSGEFYE